METHSGLLALCKWNPPVTPHKGQWRGALMLSLICTWTNGWKNQRRRRWFETPYCPRDRSVYAPPGLDASTLVVDNMHQPFKWRSCADAVNENDHRCVWNILQPTASRPQVHIMLTSVLNVSSSIFLLLHIAFNNVLSANNQYQLNVQRFIVARTWKYYIRHNNVAVCIENLNHVPIQVVFYAGDW